MALASFRTLNSPGPTVSISFVASNAIPDFVSPARLPGFRFGFDLEVFLIGILVMARRLSGGREESGASYRNREIGALSE